MRIEITRSGGFAGITRSWTLEVSRAEAEQRWLPLAEAEEGAAMGGESAAARSGADARGHGQQRDRFTYRISIGYTEVSLTEGRLDDSWRELIDRARAEGPDDAGSGAPRELL